MMKLLHSLDPAPAFLPWSPDIPLDQIPLGLAIFDQQLRLRRCNSLWASTVGLVSTPPPCPVKPGRHLVELLPGAEVSLKPLFERALAGQQVHQEAVRLEHAGQVTYWDVALSPFLECGHVQGVVNILAATRPAPPQPAKAHLREWEAQLKVAQDGIALESERLLHLILDQLKQVIDYSQAALVRPHPDHLAVWVYPAARPQEAALSQQSWRWQELLHCREPFLLADTLSDSSLAPAFWELAGQLSQFKLAEMRSWLGVPLLSHERAIGLLCLFHHQPNQYALEHVSPVLAFAQQVAISLENEPLYQQVRQLATLAERDRLARALHDRLAQTLGYINIKSSLANEFLAKGQIRQAQAHLTELKQVTQETYGDVREAIFNLRTKPASGPDFLPALHTYLVDYQARYGLEVVLEQPARIEFSTEVSTQLLRIIQEALSNIRKHAQASRVVIRCIRAAKQLGLSIEDDGRGFDPQQLPRQARLSFGLEIMRERAESVGGRVELDARPGHGTRLVVWLPDGARG